MCIFSLKILKNFKILNKSLILLIYFFNFVLFLTQLFVILYEYKQQKEKINVFKRRLQNLITGRCNYSAWLWIIIWISLHIGMVRYL